MQPFGAYAVLNHPRPLFVPLNLTGLDIVGTGEFGATVYLNQVQFQQSCCFPPTGWSAFLGTAGHANSPFVTSSGCVNGTGDYCWNQSVSFRNVTLPITSSPSPSRTKPDYLMVWRDVKYLCEARMGVVPAFLFEWDDRQARVCVCCRFSTAP